jgi:hypothetical protein
MIESSTFGSEFVSMKIAMEMNAALRYKLRMMGVPIEGPSNTFGDNSSVVKNVTLPESTLHKRHNSIAYHTVSVVRNVHVVQLGWHMSQARRTVVMALQNVWLALRSTSLLRVFCFEESGIYMVQGTDAILIVL